MIAVLAALTLVGAPAQAPAMAAVPPRVVACLRCVPRRPRPGWRLVPVRRPRLVCGVTPLGGWNCTVRLVWVREWRRVS